jgi:uncharacterized protein YoxC
MPVLTTPLRRAAAGTDAADIGALIAAWSPVMNAIQTNLFIADLGLTIRFANTKAIATLRSIERDLISAFNIRVEDILGGSIHRFHRNPQRVEDILARGHALPHQARFSFGGTTLDSDINGLYAADGTHLGYIVNWEDITDLARSNNAVKELGGHLSTAATAVEQMGASIQEVSRNAADAAQTATQGVDVAEQTRALVQELGERSREIGQVIKVITTIAQQTNLLALNATIEAARAGEFGKGFAVVAGEVKELARGTSDATDDIGAKIDGVQRNVEQVVESISQIADVITSINDFQTSIAGAVEQQSAATSSLALSIGEAAQGSADLVAQLGA